MSCRKASGEGRDSLQALDKLIQKNVLSSNLRPHQLFLTGDRIYADDVSDTLLFSLAEASAVLVGDEPLPGVTREMLNDHFVLGPGHRLALVQQAGLTPQVGLTLQEDPAKSHLFKFGEFCAMYLFGWNQYLWPQTLPTFDNVHPGEAKEVNILFGVTAQTSRFKTFNNEREFTQAFRDSIIAVRRALANVSTYMVLDDHEVSDDFYLNRLWCQRVLGNALGRRVVQNALASFALFQAWGNDPTQFAVGKPGRQLLDTLKTWTTGGFSSAAESTLQTLLRIAPLADESDSLPAPNPQQHVVWHFKAVGPQHRVLVFDTRTVRQYPTSKPGERAKSIALAAAGVVSPTAILKQLEEFGSSPAQTQVTFVVLTLPFVPTPIIEFLQKFLGEFIPNQRSISQELGEKAVFKADFEGFEFDVVSFQTLMARLAALGPVESNKRKTRVVLLSGDIHFSYCARVNYWAPRPFGDQSSQATEAIFVQLVSSSVKKEEFLTRGLGRIGFLPLVGLPSPDFFAGWRNPTGMLLEVGMRTFVGPGQSQRWTVNGTPAIAELNERAVLSRSYSMPPDWRYRIEFLRGNDNIKRLEADTFGTEIIPEIPASDPNLALQEAIKAERNHRFYFCFLAPGREIAGHNNLCHVFFSGGSSPAEPLKVIQEAWWWLGKLTEPEPLTRWEVSLAFDEEPPL